MTGSDGFHIDFDGNLLLDDNGEPIPNHMCICAAHSSSECCCGAWYVSMIDEDFDD